MNPKSSFLLGFAALFFATSLLGLWAAYDQEQAVTRFVLLNCGLLLVFVAGLLSRQQRIQVAPNVAMVVTLLVVGLGVYYLTQRAGTHDAFGGIMGSALAILLPQPIANLVRTLRSKQWLASALAALATAVGGIALRASGERGAMLSLFVGGLVAVLFGLLVHQEAAKSLTRTIRWLVWIGGALAFAGYLAFVTMPSVATWVGDITQRGPDSDIWERRELWNNTLALIGDYPFTGSGLGSPAMALASYVYISHVVNQPHSHNLFLQVGAEQGWLGLSAMLGMVLLAIVLAMESVPSHTQELQAYRLAAIASTICLFVYGLLDAEVYAYWSTPLTFVPIALALLVRSSPRRHHRHKQLAQSNTRGRVAWIGLAVVALSALLWLKGGSVRSALFANLASVAQTQAELSVYNYQTWGVQDRLRREPGGVNLETAEQDLRIALVLNPQNETALRRSGQIALARGDYAGAEELLQTAWQLAPQHRANRQLLGEVLAVQGQIAEAARQWQTLSFLDSQLEGRIWWYDQIGNAQAANNLRLTMAELTTKK